jgi:copper transport protein
MTHRRYWAWSLTITVAVTAAVVVVSAAAQPVGAHAFLVRTTPTQGARLEAAPDEVSLEFSEAFDAETARLDLTVVAGPAWVGALVLLVVDLRRERRSTGMLAVARRYARLAAVLVAILAAAGIASAVLLLDTPSDLWTTNYGQALTVKTSLVAIALGLATLGRRALARRAIARLRQTTPFETAALAGVLAVTALLVNLAPPGAAMTSGASLLGPPPIRGPVVRDGGLAGQLTVAVTANGRQLRVEVFAPGGRPAADAEVEVEAQLPNAKATTLLPRPCGPGCFTQRIDLPQGTSRLKITATDPEWASGLHVAQLDMPPPPNQPELLSELTATMQSVPTVGFTETTTSGPGSTSTPDPFELAGSRFVELEPWAAGTADDIQPLARERGFRMYLPGDRIWITVWQDDQGRIARERIVSLSHEIERDNFSYPTP